MLLSAGYGEKEEGERRKRSKVGEEGREVYSLLMNYGLFET